MNKEMEFKNIVAQYSKVASEEMNNEMRFREYLGFSSLDFMSFLGELEDTFDLELDESESSGLCCGYSVEISERQAGIYELNAVTNDKYLSVFFLISSSLTP